MMIRGRLFWTILLGFWLTFIVMSQLLWLAFSLYGERHKPLEEEVVTRIATMQTTTAAAALQLGGLAELNRVMAQWPEKERRYLAVTSLSPSLPDGEIAAPKGEPPDVHPLKQVSGPEGERYQIGFNVNQLRDEFRPNRPLLILNIPSPLFWIAGLGGLLFSWLLAWHLVWPLNQLRGGFERVAQGDLAVRLLPAMRKRHDEISEVARDFDSMVERLEILVSTREQLLHDVSHELRSPLARLQLAIGLARQNAGNTESSLSRIEREAARMDKMIGELLALSRTQNADVDEEYFDLLGLVTAVVNDARYEAQVPGVEILLQADDGIDHTVKGNAELMRRAIDNIVRNALRFSSRAQQVQVSLSGDEHEWTIRVADQGPGVEKSKLSSIFDPFIRIKSPLSGKGYGLGLAIARRVVQAHGGHIEAENGAQGGLVICLLIPRWK
ncbi:MULTISPECIES: ATP-binding protein [Brenneria]|uniref:histidine kinase n=1 Tax=Brenneria nigrifluens DSM 30175 = ATCC 13028 TaxID=1121120 RepID=A0A2U1UEX5_9GAMM|nr:MULTISPECIES: ATP-binding protein [Brenneria]EHD23016.1 integral membrane sensor signal transduction histidine kinase [Brenneria sp. EniD312]PWC20124.1 HAMP domain-containing protein [Brenneria nigrifluens DSM 30175 = ATCC 13028]QCR05913.1 HAMP domain-containing protein [Brenneria nigrifluens DSM 30175 = ATCC 13028]